MKPTYELPNFFQKLRMNDQPDLPKILNNLACLSVNELKTEVVSDEIRAIFPNLSNQKIVRFISGKNKVHQPKKVGVLFSGGQAAGGHNVIIGLFHALKKLNQTTQLFGFIQGPDGLLKNTSIELNEKRLSLYLNQGGFDLLGSSRTKIEKEEQFHEVSNTVKALNLDGLVIIGGDDSNTNAAFLAEYFARENISTQVIGVPKTIDGDLKNELVEISFGFDTATKTYSEIIGNISRDALSAKKYYYFIKLMGRSASHVTLECALQVHPNLALISEEIEYNNKTINDLVSEISDMIAKRASHGKDYGVILIPEGLLEFVKEVKILISELNIILSEDKLAILEMDAMQKDDERYEFIVKLLTEASKHFYQSLTREIQMQLLEARDPHGNVQVSKIDTERFFIELVTKELKKRAAKGLYSSKFNAQPIFCGYEGRSCFPSNFDCRYCMTLGYVAGLLINEGLTGYMASVQNLAKNVDDWQIAGVPLLNMMHFEQRKGHLKAVVKKALVDLESALFKTFADKRDDWVLLDDYQYPGPIQFYGPAELTSKVTLTLLYKGD